jgi:hypothetical protein
MYSLVDRIELTPELAQTVVVRATPNPGRFNGPDQPMRELGVVDADDAELHRGRIQVALNKLGWQIRRVEIKAGPDVTSAQCAEAVLNYAF